jgi:hypothetical protein
MSEIAIEVAGAETRQAMLRVWMAISAVWAAFWISIAGFILLTGLMPNPLIDSLHLLALIIVVPPFVLLALGTATRLIFELISRKIRNT